MNPKVSVIIPTYNRPETVKRAINSVFKQTYQGFEIIIVDDSPNDETQKIVGQFKDERIKYIKTEDVKEGSASARKRNTGVKNINQSSKYVAFLDDDDEYLPSFLEDTIKELDNKKDLGAVTSYAEFRTTDGKRLKICRPAREFWEAPVGSLWVLRREIFEKENIWFDEKIIFDDLDFGVRLPKNYKRGVIPKVSRVYYALPLKRGESLSTKYEKLVEASKYFFKKNYSIYFHEGKKALGFLYFFVGKTHCQAGKFKEGRFYFKTALKLNPTFKYFFYYFLSLFSPGVFQSHRLLILKHKILGKLLKI